MVMPRCCFENRCFGELVATIFRLKDSRVLLIDDEVMPHDELGRESLPTVSPLQRLSVTVEMQLTRSCYVRCDDQPPIQGNNVKLDVFTAHGVIMSQKISFFLVHYMLRPKMAIIKCLKLYYMTETPASVVTVITTISS
jgi:hypothetical protein